MSRDATPLLVSVHMPKTAGTSLAEALRAHFGPHLHLEYGLVPFNMPRGRRELQALARGWALRHRIADGRRAIHGHFLPVMYRCALARRPSHFVTWLRHPVERLVSHYAFWRRTSAKATRAQPLRYRMVQENWSLERFCLAPEMRNLYRQCLWGFDRSRFAFIGITERYEEDLVRFAERFLDGNLPAVTHARANPERAPSDTYAIDATLRARIERCHAHDMALYEWAMARRR